jgi:hypothetical protein
MDALTGNGKTSTRSLRTLVAEGEDDIRSQSTYEGGLEAAHENAQRHRQLSCHVDV